MAIWMWASYVGVGLLAGFCSGLLGIGGGLVVVPCMLVIFAAQGFPPSVLMHFAVGTSLLTMVVTTGASVFSHWRHGVTVWDLYPRVAVGIIPGVAVGVVLGHHFHSHFLQMLFGLFVSLMAFRLWMSLRGRSVTWFKRMIRLPLWAPALLVGIASGLFGIGSGVFSPILLAYQLNPRRVVVLCATCSFSVATVGSLVAILVGSGQHFQPAMSYGYVYLPAVLSMAAVSPFAAWCGAAVSLRLSPRMIQCLILMFLVGIAVHSLSTTLLGVHW